MVQQAVKRGPTDDEKVKENIQAVAQDPEAPKVQAQLPLTLPTSRDRERTSQSTDRLNPDPNVHCKMGCCREEETERRLQHLQTEGKGSELELLNLI